MTVKVGDRVRIIHSTNFHTIPIGEIVVVSKVDNGRVFADYRGYNYIVTGDIERINTELELIANLATEVTRLKTEVESLKSKLNKVIRCL